LIKAIKEVSNGNSVTLPRLSQKDVLIEEKFKESNLLSKIQEDIFFSRFNDIYEEFHNELQEFQEIYVSICCERIYMKNTKEEIKGSVLLKAKTNQKNIDTVRKLYEKLIRLFDESFEINQSIEYKELLTIKTNSTCSACLKEISEQYICTSCEVPHSFCIKCGHLAERKALEKEETSLHTLLYSDSECKEKEENISRIVVGSSFVDPSNDQWGIRNKSKQHGKMYCSFCGSYILNIRYASAVDEAINLCYSCFKQLKGKTDKSEGEEETDESFEELIADEDFEETFELLRSSPFYRIHYLQDIEEKQYTFMQI